MYNQRPQRNRRQFLPARLSAMYLALVAPMVIPAGAYADLDDASSKGHARNVIFFVGDGMGVSTVTAARIFSVGVDGELVIDQFPSTALSRTSTTDHITPDSAGTMTSMMTGVNTNQGLIGFGPETERNDFNADGDGAPLWTVLEQAKQRGMQVGVVSTARTTHATPAATYAHVNDRNKENDIALQALPADPTYNTRLADGLDILWGGGRRHFCPSGTNDEEGDGCSRGDGRDLRQEFQAAGYSYVYNQAGFNALTVNDLPSLGLFERSHMEYEYDRPGDLGSEPSLSDMTVKAIQLLEQATAKKSKKKGYFLMVESGRIDHAHHEGNAFRALTETEEFDKAIGAAIDMVDLRRTLIIVTADHSHVFTIAGYPMRPASELPYTPGTTPAGYLDNNNPASYSGILDVVYDINGSTGDISESSDSNGVPYTILGYHNGPGYRGGPRVDPRTDPFPGRSGVAVSGPEDTEYLQETAVPLSSETHAAEEVAIYAIGPQSFQFHGTVPNSFIAKVMRSALQLPNLN